MNTAIIEIANPVTFTVLRDEWDEDGIEVTPTTEESAALIEWHGECRTVYLPDLGSPTFSEFGESKAAAFQAALAALERATA